MLHVAVMTGDYYEKENEGTRQTGFNCYSQGNEGARKGRYSNVQGEQFKGEKARKTCPEAGC